jgi:hypothetical protein
LRFTVIASSNAAMESSINEIASQAFPHRPESTPVNYRRLVRHPAGTSSKEEGLHPISE